ncbi:WD40 repeat [Macleaya cordata]|uniref:WD40 repeat n=1 Tax=Macleaya cordata TaxID=56857 RepID=A0A200RBM6_MACCD|nr:WD40 repeat [Macleaya cordata]
MTTSQEILLASSPETLITAYDASTGATLGHFTGSRSPRKGLALAGKKLIAASHISPDATSASIHLYNWWSSIAFHHLPVPEPVAPLAATPDGLYLFSGGLSGYIHALTLPSGDLLRSFPAHSKPVSCLTMNDDNSLLISGGDDGTISVFPILRVLDNSSIDNLSQFALYSFHGHGSSVTCITTGMGGCNSTIISCSSDCTCKFWSIATGSHMRTVRFPCMIWSLAMDSTETNFYAGGSDGRLYVGVLKVKRRELISSDNEVVAWAPEHGGAVTAVVMANEGRNVVSASEDGSIRVWEVESGRMVRVLGHHERGGSISELVLAKGIINGRRCRRYGNGGGGGGSESEGGEMSLGFSGREIRKPVREVNEMEEMLSVVVKDRRRAIDRLEAAIGTYERLLGLILKEAKAGDTTTTDHNP